MKSQAVLKPSLYLRLKPRKKTSRVGVCEQGGQAQQHLFIKSISLDHFPSERPQGRGFCYVSLVFVVLLAKGPGDPSFRIISAAWGAAGGRGPTPPHIKLVNYDKYAGFFPGRPAQTDVRLQGSVPKGSVHVYHLTRSPSARFLPRSLGTALGIGPISCRLPKGTATQQLQHPSRGEDTAFSKMPPTSRRH